MNKMQEMGLMNDYTIGWSIYLLGAVGMFIVVWRCSRSWPALLRQGLRFIVGCVVLVPAQVETAKDALAPAFIVAIFDGATGNSEGAATALSSLALAIILGLLFYAVWWAGKHYYRRKRAATLSPREVGDLPERREPLKTDDTPTIAA